MDTSEINGIESSLPSRDASWRIFDRIAPRYDLLNHLLSGGQDILWRQIVARQVKETRSKCLLDLATGTADQLISICQRCPEVEKAIGLDMSGEMLEIGRQKLIKNDLTVVADLIHGNALELPIASGSVDLVTITFGIRNLPDVSAALREMHRVLRENGSIIILEFSLPSSALILWFYLLYFRHILPAIGGPISGDKTAYKYLNKTVESFPYGNEFCELMVDAGFDRDIKTRQLTFGISTIYHGWKRAL